MKTVIHYIVGLYLPITENWIYGQIKNLTRYQPVVYAFETKNLEVFPVERIRALSFKNRGKAFFSGKCIFLNKVREKIFRIYSLASFAVALKKDRPSLIHAHFGPSGYNFLPLKRINGNLPLITTFYGFDLSMLPCQDPGWKKKYNKLFRQGDRFLVEGSHMKKSLAELGCPPDKIIVQHLGVDLAKTRFVPRNLKINEEIRILVAGSFHEKKGIPYAVEAFSLAREKYRNLKLTIIGDSPGDPEGEKEKQKILSVIKNNHIEDSVRLMGYQPHSVFLEELYDHHILLSPSICSSNGDTEGGAPVSIIEASASGLPVLSTTHCDIPEVVINGESGCLVPERDAGALSVKLEYLVSNPENWEEMGRKGRAHIERNYNIITQVQKLEEIYDDLINQNENTGNL